MMTGEHAVFCMIIVLYIIFLTSSPAYIDLRLTKRRHVNDEIKRKRYGVMQPLISVEIC